MGRHDSLKKHCGRSQMRIIVNIQRGAVRLNVNVVWFSEAKRHSCFNNLTFKNKTRPVGDENMPFFKRENQLKSWQQICHKKLNLSEFFQDITGKPSRNHIFFSTVMVYLSSTLCHLYYRYWTRLSLQVGHVLIWIWVIFRVCPSLKPHILFYSNHWASWHSFPDVTHIIYWFSTYTNCNLVLSCP